MTMLETDFEREKRLRQERNVFATEQDAVIAPHSGARYGAHDRNAPFFEGRDIVAGIVAATMMLGPLLASAAGFGA